MTRTDELRECSARLKAAISGERFERAAELLQEYRQFFDSVLHSCAAEEKRDLVAEASATLKSLSNFARISRAHAVRQFAAIPPKGRYQSAQDQGNGNWQLIG